MRAVSVHPDALVVTSVIWRTNAVALRSEDGSESMLIDSPYLPDELELLPTVLEQAGFGVDALLATHADFDHLLGRQCFPELALGVGEETMLRLKAEPGAAQRELRDFDAELYVERPRPLALGSVQALPVPGRLDLGQDELELHPAEGHTADGTAIFARRVGVLVVGDYLSDVEIPMVSSGGSRSAYRATLVRLASLVEEAETVVPGHGSTLSGEEAAAILAQDLAYLDALDSGETALPPGRDSARQRQIHAQNVEAAV